MKFTRSNDGVERTSINVTIRLDRKDIANLRKVLVERGLPSTENNIRELVRTCTDYTAPMTIRQYKISSEPE